MKRPLYFLLLSLLFCMLLNSASAATYGTVNHDGVRFRRQAESTDVWAMLDTGWQVEILNTKRANGVNYYYVVCGTPKNPTRQYWGYIQQEYVSVSGAPAATSAPAATPIPEAAIPASPVQQTVTAAPVGNGAGGYVQFIVRGVNLRQGPSTGTKSLGQFKEGQIVAFTDATVSNGRTWYQVSKDGVTGYVLGTCVQVVNGAQATAAPAVTAAPEATAAPAAPASSIALTTMEKVIVRAEGSARATQIKLLNSAGQVCTLTGATSQADGYTWYQLSVKNITGWIRGDLLRVLSAEEAAAYTNTNASAGGTTLYTPELADWNTSDIQKIFYKGCVATVTDVKTGISFQVKRWSGGSHADVEPLTAADTAAMCKIYGVSTAQEIADKDLYQRRAILVTVGGHSYAASMYGEPHNDEGNTIKDNNFQGQFCIHFTNSKTHGSDKVDADHQKAVTYAYTNGVSQLTQYGYAFQ